MSFGTDLLAEARTLSTAINSTAARRRTIIGRAYYAAFHEMLNCATPRGYCPTGKLSVHAQLITWLNTSGSRDLRRAGGIMKQLRALRADADYEPSVAITAQNARDAVDKAITIIEEIAADLSCAP